MTKRVQQNCRIKELIYKFKLYFYKPVTNNMKMKLREYSQHHRKVLNILEYIKQELV